MRDSKEHVREVNRSIDPQRGAGQFVGVDLDLSRRPGYQQNWKRGPLPNTKYPPDWQVRDIEVFMHGRPNKTFPPVFGTDAPPHGLSGMVRKAAYFYPDHLVRHWLMLLAADRVDSFERHAKKLAPFALPLLAVGALAAFSRPRKAVKHAVQNRLPHRQPPPPPGWYPRAGARDGTFVPGMRTRH